MIASENGRTEIVQLLLSQPGIDITCKNIYIEKSFMTFLVNCFMIFSFHINDGISIHFRNNFDALHYARSKNHQKIVDLLSKANQN